MTKISVVVNTLNERDNLPRALASVKDFSDEIVVVDMESEDDTVKIAKKAGAKVYNHKKAGYVEPARNFAIKKATGDWILILDADEEVPKALAKELKLISNDARSADYYRVARKNIIFGKWMRHSRWWPDYNIRFFRKGFVSWNEIIHSVPTTTGAGLDLEAKEGFALIHHHYDSVDQYLTRMNRYTSHQAKSMCADGYEFDWKDLIAKPVSEFASRFFQAEGYKDGLHGAALSALQAFSEFVKYLKVWQMAKFQPSAVNMEDFKEELKKAERELHYWGADALVKESGGLKNRLKRKFRLP